MSNITTYYKWDSVSEIDNTQLEQNRELRNRPGQIGNLGRGDIANLWANVTLLNKWC